jgi:hypothetical protein
MNLYIAGDSYCFYREDPTQHWPAALAHSLDLNLTGAGYPGQGWWALRRDLIAYSKTAAFDQTQVFVLCHTEPARMLTSQPIWNTGQEEPVKEVYYKYIYSADVAAWAVEQWYQELNRLLQGRTVVHVPCFEHPEFELLQCTRLDQPLLELSIRSAGGSTDLAGWGGSEVRQRMNDLPNHLSPEHNIELAELIKSKISF